MNIWMAQVNYKFGDNAFLPYSAGRLIAAAMERPGQHFQGFLVFREPREEVLARLDEAPPSVLGISCYLWNWRYSLRLASWVKNRWPDCTIILGGPQVPAEPDIAFFARNPAVDLLIHGEGEMAFRLALHNLYDYGEIGVIPGSSRPNGALHRGKGNRLASLDGLPSPYLEGYFNHLITLYPEINWHMSQETNRGCPYQCSFCDWGSATFSKVREFPLDVVLDEMAWGSEKGLELLYNCDANFGMRPRDIQIAEHMVKLKADTGSPAKFRAAYAKKTTPKVYEIGRLLAQAGLSKGVTLSAQSMNPETLDAVSRRPLVSEEFAQLVASYKADGVPTYTEIILGLPGETLKSFKAGLLEVLTLGQHDGLNVYPAIVLDNSEMGNIFYRKKHGIKSMRLSMLLLHASWSEADPAPEEYDLVVETSTMTHEEWKEAMVFGWFIQGLHCMGLTRDAAIASGNIELFYHSTWRRIKTGKLQWLSHYERCLHELLCAVLNGEADWNHPIDDYGDNTWPPEERLFIWCMENIDRVCEELDIPVPDLARPDDYENRETWAREVVWYGRKGGRRKAA